MGMQYTSVTFIMGFLSLLMGCISIYMTLAAKRYLAKGIIHKYLSFYIGSVILIMAFCLLYTVRNLYGLNYVMIEYIEYYLLTASFFSLVLVSYRTLHIGKTFGFRDVARSIKTKLEK